MDRETYIQGLRDLADALEQNPEFPQPPCYNNLNLFFEDLEGLVRAAKALPGFWKKEAAGDYFELRRQYGPLTLILNIKRELVCTRVVKGTRIVPARPAYEVEDVEWECEHEIFRGGGE